MADYKFEKLFIYTVILTFGFNILTVNAIKCHQCNSFVDMNCDDLKFDEKTKTMTDKYLKNCTMPENADSTTNHTLFCRKTTYFINYEESSRTVRSCGWLKEHHNSKNNRVRRSCLSADNEGYIETICVCNTDGCNSAPNQFTRSTNILVSSCGIIGVLLIKYLSF